MSHPFTEIAHSDMYSAVFSLFIKNNGRIRVAEFVEAVNDLGGDGEDVTLIRAVMEREGLQRTGDFYDWPAVREIFQLKPPKAA